MPCKMFGSAEYHTAFAIASALESLCRSGPITLVDATGDDWEGGWVVVDDEGGHVWVGGGEGVG